MDKTGLCPELQNIVDRFVNFRIKYTTLKAHSDAQEELLELQKLEMDKMNLQVEKLSTTFIEWQKCCNVKLRNLESENQRLQKIIDNLQHQGGANAHQARRQNEAKVRDLEEQLKKLKSQMIEENDKSRERIESMKKNYEEEISLYEKKLAHFSSIEKRQSNEIAMYKKKELEEKKNALVNSESQKNKKQTTHPALEDNAREEHKRRNSSAFKWPQLDFDLEKDSVNNQQAVSRPKKKKLFNIDNETIVDLTS